MKKRILILASLTLMIFTFSEAQDIFNMAAFIDHTQKGEIMKSFGFSPDQKDFLMEGSLIYENNSNIGIGTDNPLFNLHVFNSATLGLQNAKVINDGEIASITVGDLNKIDQAKILFNRALGQRGKKNGYNGTEIVFYTTPDQGNKLKPTLKIGGDEGLTCYSQTSFHGTLILNGNWISANNQHNGIFIDNNNNIGMGTDNLNSNFKLTVAGGIFAREVLVKASAGADFVFKDDYCLPTLNEIEKFVSKNKRLPDIPSAKQMQEDGLNLGDMQIKLLQKIEELTLYVIEQDKKISTLAKENKSLQNKISSITNK